MSGLLDALARLALATVSRVINAWRLRHLPDHRRRVRRARRVLVKLRSPHLLQEPARCFAYLRKVDALVFEELVLTAFEDAGWPVLRNRSYSGDGGLDGVVYGPGMRRWALQVKRYGSHVRAEHLSTLASVVAREGFAGGMFVHCGRTGRLSWAIGGRTGLHVLSGQALLELLQRGIAPSLRQRVSRSAGVRPTTSTTGSDDGFERRGAPRESVGTCVLEALDGGR